MCTGTPWFFRLPATYAGWHPQWHRWAAGESVWAPDTLFSRGVPFTSEVFQLSRNHGLRLWRRVPEKNGDKGLGTHQRLLSLAHPIIRHARGEEKECFHLQLNHIQKKKKPTGDPEKIHLSSLYSFPAFSLLLFLQILFSESPARDLRESVTNLHTSLQETVRGAEAKGSYIRSLLLLLI